MSKNEISSETLVGTLMMTMPDEIVPSVIMSLANIAVRIAKGKIPADKVPNDEWEMALEVIRGVVEKFVLEKLSKKTAGDAAQDAGVI